MMNLLTNNKIIHKIVLTLYIRDKFSFTWDVYKETRIEEDYLNPAYEFNNFKIETKVIIKFQGNFIMFIAFQKINILKRYLICLLHVYLIDNPRSKTISTFKNCFHGDNKWIITLLHIKKICTRINSLNLTIGNFNYEISLHKSRWFSSNYTTTLI